MTYFYPIRCSLEWECPSPNTISIWLANCKSWLLCKYKPVCFQMKCITAGKTTILSQSHPCLFVLNIHLFVSIKKPDTITTTKDHRFLVYMILVDRCWATGENSSIVDKLFIHMTLHFSPFNFWLHFSTDCQWQFIFLRRWDIPSHKHASTEALKF